MKTRAATVLAVLLLAIGGWQFGAAAWIHAKALLAKGLIDQAWAETRGGGARVKPWRWADTWPVARLAVPRLGIDQIILAGASGRTLAFGPGHMDGTAGPGEAGVSVISGHRDTHFRFLQNLRPGDSLVLTDARGRPHRYRISDTQVVDSETAGIRVGGDTPWLALVTCYPFDAIRPGGPLRYLVLAAAEAAVSATLPVPSTDRARTR